MNNLKRYESFDSDGNSIILYHGSENSFDEFNIRYFNSGSGDGGWLGKGFYFTNDYSYAESYGEVRKYKIKLNNPYIITDFYYSTRPLKLINELGVSNSSEIAPKLKSMGYDSVLLRYNDTDIDLDEDIDLGENTFVELCIFDSNQIKRVMEDVSESRFINPLSDKIRLFEEFNLNKSIINSPFSNSKVRGVVYHSSDASFTEFDLDMIGDGSSSTSLEGVYFSDTKQLHFGGNIIEAFINIENPIIIDMQKTRFDSGSIQEAIYDFIYSDGGSHMVNDMIEYGEVEDSEEAWEIIENWQKTADGVILKNIQYANHNTEYIVINNPNLNDNLYDINKRIKII